MATFRLSPHCNEIFCIKKLQRESRRISICKGGFTLQDVHCTSISHIKKDLGHTRKEKYHLELTVFVGDILLTFKSYQKQMQSDNGTIMTIDEHIATCKKKLEKLLMDGWTPVLFVSSNRGRGLSIISIAHKTKHHPRKMIT